MLKIYVGPVPASTEFMDFDLAVTADREVPKYGLWFTISENDISFHNFGLEIGERRWRVPIAIDETIFEFEDLKIAALYGKELRMRRLLHKIYSLKISMILGYLKTDNYNPYALMASGWGCSQYTGLPTLIVNFAGDTIGYSLFSKMNGFSDGVQLLFERYAVMKASVEREDDLNKRIKKNKGLRND